MTSMELQSIGKWLLGLGIFIALMGVAVMFLPRISWLGRLPGDIVHEGEHSTFYFPLTTSILLSVGLSLLLWLISRLRR